MEPNHYSGFPTLLIKNFWDKKQLIYNSPDGTLMWVSHFAVRRCFFSFFVSSCIKRLFVVVIVCQWWGQRCCLWHKKPWCQVLFISATLGESLGATLGEVLSSPKESPAGNQPGIRPTIATGHRTHTLANDILHLPIEEYLQSSSLIRQVYMGMVTWEAQDNYLCRENRYLDTRY